MKLTCRSGPQFLPLHCDWCAEWTTPWKRRLVLSAVRCRFPLAPPRPVTKQDSTFFCPSCSTWTLGSSSRLVRFILFSVAVTPTAFCAALGLVVLVSGPSSLGLHTPAVGWAVCELQERVWDEATQRAVLFPTFRRTLEARGSWRTGAGGSSL
ncbi:hypothetical protein CB1_000114025 [Camelus ferus]|nr:hypothetical protein CB1_000114025 [Camelus ferus]